MAEYLHTFASGEFNLRWQEPYVSQGVDKMLVGIVPRGVVRGFRLVTAGAGQGLAAKLLPDSEALDHVAVCRTSGGHILTARKTAADANEAITLSLTNLASKTAVIVLEAAYVAGAATTFRVVGYDEAAGEWATAKPDVTVLGVVTVPANGDVAASAVKPRMRMPAWLERGVDASDWIPLVPNPGFEGYANAGSTVVRRFFGWGGTKADGGAISAWTLALETSDVARGKRALKATIPAAVEDARIFVGGPTTGRDVFTASPGDLVYVRAHVKPSSPVNATGSLLVRFRQSDGSTEVGSGEAVAFPTSGSWQKIEGMVRVPATAHGDAADAWYLTVELKLSASGGGSGYWLVDDVQAWKQRSSAVDLEDADGHGHRVRRGSGLVLAGAGLSDEWSIAAKAAGLIFELVHAVADQKLTLGSSTTNAGVILETFRHLLLSRGIAKNVVPVAHGVYSTQLPKAWLSASSGGGIFDAFNVATLGFEGASSETGVVTFHQALADTNYVVVGSARGVDGAGSLSFVAHTMGTTGFKFSLVNEADAKVNLTNATTGVSCVVYGRWPSEV